MVHRHRVHHRRASHSHHRRHGRGLRAYGSGLTAYSKGGRIHRRRRGKGLFDSLLGGLFG